jgi:hypothetical protein
VRYFTARDDIHTCQVNSNLTIVTPDQSRTLRCRRVMAHLSALATSCITAQKHMCQDREYAEFCICIRL